MKIKKILFTVLGIISLTLGVIGIVVPILPTTPFLLLASYLLVKGSKRLNEKLLRSKVLGGYIYNYREYHAIKRKERIVTLTVLWVTLLISGFLIMNIYIWILLGLVGAGVTTHLVLLNTLENIKK